MTLTSQQAAGLRGVLFLLGKKFETGLIPTGIPGLGEMLGQLFQIGALFIPAGDKNTDNTLK